MPVMLTRIQRNLDLLKSSHLGHAYLHIIISMESNLCRKGSEVVEPLSRVIPVMANGLFKVLHYYGRSVR